MPSVTKSIEIEGQSVAALFDTRVANSYLLSRFIGRAVKVAVAPPVRIRVGPRTIEVRQWCVVQGKIEGLDFWTDMAVVDDLDWVEGHDLGSVIGRRTMGQWEIGIDPETGTLSLDGLRRREFTEY